MEDKTQAALAHLTAAQPMLEEKAKASARMGELAKSICDQTDLEKFDVHKYKDMLYYKGRGWTESPISKPDPDEKFKDRVSPTFRKLVQIVNILRNVGDLALLQEYLDAVRAEGIEIKISETAPLTSRMPKEMFDEAMRSMCHEQKIICENADEVREMGPNAEQDGFCPEGAFKGFAEDWRKILKGKDKTESLLKIHERSMFHAHGAAEVVKLQEEVNGKRS